jgi:Flp pilus assembly protein CpaB
MWKVKRMNTARIVDLTVAVGAGGIAAYLANGSDTKPSPTAPIAQKQTMDVLTAKSDIGLGQSVAPARQSGALSLALRSIAGLNAVEKSSDDQAPKRDNRVNVVRYGVLTPTTTK